MTRKLFLTSMLLAAAVLLFAVAVARHMVIAGAENRSEVVK